MKHLYLTFNYSNHKFNIDTKTKLGRSDHSNTLFPLKNIKLPTKADVNDGDQEELEKRLEKPCDEFSDLQKLLDMELAISKPLLILSAKYGWKSIVSSIERLV